MIMSDIYWKWIHSLPRRNLVFVGTIVLVVVTNFSSLTGFSVADISLLRDYKYSAIVDVSSPENVSLTNKKSTSIPINLTSLRLDPFSKITTVTENVTTLAACLLMKDDNDILNEWIAYHYHLWNLRHLIIAIDPTSLTSPQQLLEKWKIFFSLDVVEWHDADYMPSDFLRGDYSKVKHRMGSLPEKHPNRTFTPQEIQQIFNHRFRQREFYRKCLEYLDRDQQSQWIMHIDTDEFITLNPFLLESKEITTQRTKYLTIQPKAGSLIQMMTNHHPEDSSPCLSLPRLLFGGIENERNSTYGQWNLTLFESIRWKYHAPMVAAGPLNGRPKALLDWPSMRKQPQQRRMLLNNVHSIHRPSADLCAKNVSLDGSLSNESGPPWIAIHHYLGSLERHMTRQDPRRTVEVCSKQK